MKTTLTAKFLAYRVNPKPAREETPRQKPKYEIEGFLNAKETNFERMGRLVEALAKGFHLSPDNYLWMSAHCTLHGHPNNRAKRQWSRVLDRKQKWAQASEAQAYLQGTKGLIQGGGCSPR